MNNRPVIIWGAGHIGRGFNGEVFHAPGYRLVFVDILDDLVRALRASSGYTIHKALPDGVTSVRVTDYEAYSVKDEQAIGALLLEHQPIVSVAVFAHQLATVAQMLAPYIKRRARLCPDDPMDILLSVNMLMPDELFRPAMDEALSDDPEALAYWHEKVGLAVTVVMRVVPATPKAYLDEDPLSLFTNGFPEFIADKFGFRGELPELPMIRFTDKIVAEEVRKIYSINMAHAATSYMAIPMGMKKCDEALAHPSIRPLIEEALEETSVGLRGEYGFTEAEMAQWKRMVMDQLDNPFIGDSLNRLGADTRRKLGGDDRLVGPARLCLKHGGSPRVIARAIRAGFSYEHDDEGTRATRKLFTECGLETALREICRLSPDEPLYQMVLDA